MMVKVVDFPEQVAKAHALANNLELKLKFDEQISNIVILGMGGSGIAGDFARTLLRHSNIPVYVSKNSVPPNHITRNTLVVAITYSGKTQETLSALSKAISKGSRVIVITSSIELHTSCEAKNIQSILIPKNDYPRASLGYLLIPLLVVLQRTGIAPLNNLDFAETLSVLEEIRAQCHPEIPTAANPARILAYSLVGKLPIIYGETDFTDVVGFRWKQLFNENSKIHSYCDTFPELLHNEIEAWHYDTNTINQRQVLLILRDAQHEQDAQLIERIEAVKELIERKGTKVFEIWSKGKSELARLLSISYIADFVSVYLASSMGTDPNTIPNIEQLKKRALVPVEEL